MSDICKNCGYVKGLHSAIDYRCPLDDSGFRFYDEMHYEPLTTPTFTDDGEIKGEVFEGLDIDDRVGYPSMWLYVTRAENKVCDFREKDYLSHEFYLAAANYIETKYATQIEAFGERKRKEAEEDV